MKYMYMAMLMLAIGVGAGCSKSETPVENYTGFINGVACNVQYKELANQNRCEQDQFHQN